MKIRTSPRGDGWCAHLEPLEGVYVGAAGPDAAAALHHAARLLDHALDRPELQAVMPPGTVAAVKLLRGATAALRRGSLPEFLDSVTPTQAKVVAKALRRALPSVRKLVHL